ncbi:hypothetical protein HPB48_011283 [Haemaphysalis longicornis]|uniref:Uncharacterized protein n=1 Tax=Haemaphysalis longicornis TaxID=44386 RepID=A0A9J6GXX6_HAELO|nr:hypothetical protein HPB48_011283 [Haemaphysalis longicornis]
MKENRAPKIVQSGLGATKPAELFFPYFFSAPPQMTTAAQRAKKKWPNLDMRRECSQSPDSCWLCDRLPEWNAALRIYSIFLTESLPGKIFLTVHGTPPATDTQQDCHLEDRAAMIAWLLRKHRCIETLKLGEGNEPGKLCMGVDHIGSFGNVAVPNPVANLKTNVRHIIIANRAPDKWDSLLDAIGPIEELESLTLLGVCASPTSARKLAKLLEDNANSVRKVYVRCLQTDYRDVDASWMPSRAAEIRIPLMCS